MSFDTYEIGKNRDNLLSKWKGYHQIKTDVGKRNHEQTKVFIGDGKTYLYKREKDRFKRVSKKVKVKVSGFGGLQRAKFNGVWKAGTVIALRDLFGDDLANADYISIDGKKIPIVRGDKRVELTRKFPAINRGDVIDVVAVHKDVVEVADVIEVVDLEYEIYVTGDYTKSARGINIDGTEIIQVGAKAPNNVNEDDFWQEVFIKIKKVIIDTGAAEATHIPKGKWFEKLVHLPEFDRLYFTQSANNNPGSVSDLTDSSWLWQFNPDEADGPAFLRLADKKGRLDDGSIMELSR
jgi:hypothetical protein